MSRRPALPPTARRPHPACLVIPARTLAVALALAAGTAAAQYKVVAPDGSITYTDRPVAPPGTRVQSLGPAGTLVVPAQPALPAELRPVAARFPVTLYTGSDCSPCDSARQMLRQRGIPFAERTVSTDDDVQALQRLSNGRSLPTLAVGQQILRGWLDSDWAQTLDLAGYPKASRLPRDYSPPPATPLVARASEIDTLPSVQARPAARPAPLPEPVAAPPASGPNIRF